MPHAWAVAAILAVTAPQLPMVAPDAPPIVDMAVRLIRAGSGGSSLARSASRDGQPAYVYSGLGPCIVGAAAQDPARENSSSWRATGRVRSVERGIAIADVEWQRIDYRATGVTAAPRVRMTLTLPLGERVAVDFIETPGSACRTDALIFEIGVAPDHGTRLSMSGEGRSVSGVSGGRGGGGAGRPIDENLGADERWREAEEAARLAPTITRPMPPREYTVDLWLVPDSSEAAPSGLAQRLSKPIGGTGGRFEFPPEMITAGSRASVVDLSALVIPVDGDRLVVAITRVATPSDGATPVSEGWVKAMPMPKASAVLSFEIPAASSPDRVPQSRTAYSLRLKIGRP
ncbi:MAG TPA: hypothetical protein VFV78_13180 [Vicinamibacterales bacterium]|nr:hypothetical protein [Vicinamibacterales bacterium]